MTSEEQQRVKILFSVEGNDGSLEIESLWAVSKAGGYQIDSIPFCAKNIACNDIVSAEPDSGGMLWFKALVFASGHSTVRLWFADAGHVAAVRERLREMGCATELDLLRLVAVDIPPSTRYEAVHTYLEQQELAGVLEYEEACIGQ